MEIKKQYFLEVLNKYGKTLSASLFFSITFIAFFDVSNIVSLHAFKCNMGDVSWVYMVGMLVFYLLVGTILDKPKYIAISRTFENAWLYIMALHSTADAMILYDRYISLGFVNIFIIAEATVYLATPLLIIVYIANSKRLYDKIYANKGI